MPYQYPVIGKCRIGIIDPVGRSIKFLRTILGNYTAVFKRAYGEDQLVRKTYMFFNTCPGDRHYDPVGLISVVHYPPVIVYVRSVVLTGKLCLLV